MNRILNLTIAFVWVGIGIVGALLLLQMSQTSVIPEIEGFGITSEQQVVSYYLDPTQVELGYIEGSNMLVIEKLENQVRFKLSSRQVESLGIRNWETIGEELGVEYVVSDCKYLSITMLKQSEREVGDLLQDIRCKQSLDYENIQTFDITV